MKSIEFTMENSTNDTLQLTRDCGGLGTMLRMAYDGSGRRISKARLCNIGDDNWETALVTHYNGIGTEVRENFHNGSLNNTKVVVNMPQGLGRYQPEDAANAFASATLDENGKLKDAASALSSAFLDEKGTLEDAVKVSASESIDENGCSSGECHPGLRAGIQSGFIYEFYLKNHLGSTMMVAQVNSSNANAPVDIATAYDYRAFGEQIDLTNSVDKVTENFTGKEKDDETDLNYFGARYLDPMLGMWISVDAARQHFSPYTYGSNNPIVRIDPDGNQDEILNQYFRELEYNTAEAAKTAGKEFPGMLWRGAKDAATVGATFDPEPESRMILTALVAGMNLAEGFYEKNAGKVGLSIATLGVSTKLPNGLLSRVGQNLAADIADQLIENSPTDAPLPTKMLPTSGPAPADNTNISIPYLQE